MCVCVCVCVCTCACKCNVCECYSAVLVIRLTYTSTKTCIKNEWHDYGEYIYPARELCTFQVLFIIFGSYYTYYNSVVAHLFPAFMQA